MDDDYSKLVDTAYRLHTSGKFDEAQFLYEKLLSINPNDVNIQNLYAQLCFGLKNYDKALELFQNIYNKLKLNEIAINIAKTYYHKNELDKAVNILNSLKEPDSQCLKLLSTLYLKQNKYTNAIDTLNKLIKTSKMNYEDYFNLSLSYSNIDDIDNSLKFALKAQSIIPDDTQINLHIASLYEKKDDIISEQKYLLNIKNPSTDILYRIGVIYKNSGDTNKALEIFELILKTDKYDKNTLLNLAMMYKKTDKYKTLSILKNLSEIYPNDEIILNIMYITYSEMLNWDNSLEIAKKLIELFPDNYYYYTLAGDSQLKLYEYDDAEKMYKKALSLNKEDEYSIIQYANILANTNRVAEAMEIYKNHKIKQIEYIEIKLREKDIKSIEDWNNFYTFFNSKEDDNYYLENVKNLFYKFNVYEKYTITDDTFSYFQNSFNKFSKKNEIYHKKQWHHEDLTNKKLLVYNVNGIGDILMCIRYLNEIQKQTSKIILQVPKGLLELLKFNFSNIQMYTDEDGIIIKNLYEYTTTFMSLLYNLKIDFKNIITPEKYLTVSEAKVEEKSKLEFMSNTKKKIGLYYQGNPRILPNRSIKLEKFTPLFDIDNTQIYSFQISNIDSESEEYKKCLPLIDLSTYIKNYEDTAAFLKNIDILITIDTSIAHLAGALGIKTFLLLPYFTEWRWFHDSEYTPWYKSIKIFRQKKPNDWDEVIKRVKYECSL